jgi:aromatase
MEVKNTITINGDYKTIFKYTNNVENWPEIFTEYSDVLIIEKKEDYVKFRLTKGVGEQAKSWISERTTYPDKGYVHGIRQEPKFPFDYMNIFWEYNKISDNQTNLTIRQEFAPDSSFSSEKGLELQTFLDNAGKSELQNIKKVTEQWLIEQTHV